MRFPTDANVSRLPQLLSDFLAIIGWKEWESRGKELSLQLKQNPLLGDYFLERHFLEIALIELVAHRRSRGKLPNHIRNTAEYQLASFMAIVVGIYTRVDKRGRKRLEGMLRDGLKSENGHLPLHHEMTVAAHFLRHGFDVEPIDLTRGGGVDYVIRKDQIEAEVECKLVTADIGRKVHRKRMADLSWVLMPALKQAAASVRGGFIVNVRLPDRLTGNRLQHEEITAAVLAALENGQVANAQTGVSISVIPFSIAVTNSWLQSDHTFDTRAVRQFVDSKISEKNREVFAYGNTHCVFVIVVASVKKDDITKGIYQQMKSAAKGQFSKTMPGILAVRLTALAADQLESFKDAQAPHQNPNALQIIATRLFENPERHFLHTIAFMSAGSARRTSIVAGDVKSDITTESGLCYVFRSNIPTVASDHIFFPGG